MGKDRAIRSRAGVWAARNHSRELEMCYDGDMDSPELTYGPAVSTEKAIRRMGRPPKYETPEAMANAMTGFFDSCAEKGHPPLFTSLALALGFSCRDALDNYQKKPEFHDLVKRAKLICEDYAAKGLISGKNPTGFIFLLKQYGWRDTLENVVVYETHEQRIARLVGSKQDLSMD